MFCFQLSSSFHFLLFYLTFAGFAPLRKNLFLREEWLTQRRKARQGGTIKVRRVSTFFAI